jgi:SAM-dependent methyltransferase
MATSDGPGFGRDDLRARYAVVTVDEDEWHCHSDAVTMATVRKYLPKAFVTELGWVLNAGAGVSRLGFPREISVDLFPEPIAGRQYPVCASIARLPFRSSSIDAVVCVGEVLAYCDPSEAISEFARVMRPNGRLIIDFGSTKSWRVFATPQHGVAATALGL